MSSAEAIETVFLREFADTYLSQISFVGSTLTDLTRWQELGFTLGLSDVLYVMKTGSVVISEKWDADGAYWQVHGKTCHNLPLSITMKVWCDRYKVRVLSVAILGDENA